MVDTRGPIPDGGESGFALVAVLGLMILVASILAPFALTMRTERAALAHHTERQRLTLLVDGISRIVAWRLTHPAQKEDFPTAIPLDSSPVACVGERLSIQMRVQGHSGLIDLNAADADTIALGIEVLGAEPPLAKRIAADAVAYRTADPRELNKQDISEQAAFRGKGAPFESVSEFADVAPLLRPASTDLNSVFTVHSKSTGVNLGIAPATLRSFFPAEQRSSRSTAAPIVEPAFTIEIVATRAAGTIVGLSASQIASTGSAGLPFRRVETNGIAPAFGEQTVASFDCGVLFGRELSAYLGIGL